ncbi:hypothetical protein [Phreatobacter oligotrophus]|uniref:Uncharacterized protein n=1 Tax=Phreatobacter oligotrophus TaxID=1122261 RepID=A0A2T4ZFK9_9HYPH|nr:hypothetical protein [Phreatobacter oligotrophus]PTM60693.1 hypothetical protein C8P69_10275 [Phreatobacter oligotrophus]
MKKFFWGAARMFREVIHRNPVPSISLGQIKIDIPTDIGAFFINPTRFGFDIDDKTTPFYSEDTHFLERCYSSETKPDLPILYRQLTGFASHNILPVFSPYLDATDGQIDVVVNSTPYRLPPILHEHGDLSLRAHRSLGRIRTLKDGSDENNRSLRIIDVTESKIICQPAFYFDQIATNIVMDWDSGALGPSTTIRNSIEKPVKGTLTSLRDSVLANTLGVCAMFYNRELKPLIRVRKPNLGALPNGGLHCTVSGVYLFDDEPGRNYHLHVLGKGMVHEIERETKLDEKQFLFLPVAFGRELPRGGKPQLFFIAISLIDDDRFSTLALEAEEADEYTRFAIADEGLHKDEDGRYSYFKKYDPRVFTYEGLACIYICEKFIELNRNELLRRIRDFND